MSPAPNPHSQSSKSASSPQSRTKDQANSAPEPSSPAEPMTDQPNSLLATPPTRNLPKDTAPNPESASAKPEETPDEVKASDTVTPGTVTPAPVAASVDAEEASVEPDESSTPKPSTIEDGASVQPLEAAQSEKAEVASDATPKNAGTKPSESEVGEAATAATTAQPVSLRHQPIPPASEPMQYRAIGLVRGKYMPSEEQFTRGSILTDDEVLIDAVLLGRVMSLVKKHIDLEQSHLWVVYPRTRERDLELHMQIVGVWEPEKLNRTDSLEESAETPDETSDNLSTESEGEFLSAETVASDDSSTAEDLDDRYFSVRGEIVYESEEEQRLLVKIRRAPKPGETEGKAFKVALKGTVEGKALGYFWDLQVQRQNNELVLTQATQIGMVPPQKRGAGGRGRPPRRGPGGPPRRGGPGGPGAGGPPRKRWQGNRTEDRPVRGERSDRPERSDRSSAPSAPRQPIAKPVKRRPKDEES